MSLKHRRITTVYFAIFLAFLFTLWQFITWYLECSAEPATALILIIWPILIGALPRREKQFRGSIAERAKAERESKKDLQRATRVATVTIMTVVILGVFQLYLSNVACVEEPSPSIAISFLLDTSENMNQMVNGQARHELAVAAIESIGNISLLETSQVWRNLRIAGGGDNCDQTQLISNGTNLSNDSFLNPLDGFEFGGTNAYEVGLNGMAEDFGRTVSEADIRVAFMLLGNFDVTPCREFNWVQSLRILRGMGIDATLCIFGLEIENAEFEQLRTELLQEGIGCVYNESDPNEISQIAVGIIREQILIEEGEVEILTTPTSVIYVSSLTPNPTLAPSETPTDEPFETPTDEPSETPTDEPSETPTDEPSETPTDEPSETPAEQSAVITVTVNVANLRAGPGTIYPIIGSVQRDESFQVVSRYGDNEDLWYLIQFDEDEAWIWSEIVNLNVTPDQVVIANSIPPTPVISENTSNQAQSGEFTFDILSIQPNTGNDCRIFINLSVFTPLEAQEFTDPNTPTFKLRITSLLNGQAVRYSTQDFTYGNVIFGGYSDFLIVTHLESGEQANSIRLSLLSADGNTEYYSSSQDVQMNSPCS